MLAKLLDGVHFDFRIDEGCRRYNLSSGRGRLLLSIDGIFLSDGESLYNIPIEKISDIQRLDGDHPGIKFDVKGLNVFLRADRRDLLWALRHYLLPLVR